MEHDKKSQAEEVYRAAEEAKRAAEEARRKEEHILDEAKRTTARLEAEWKKMEEEERESKQETERKRERLRSEAEHRQAQEKQKEEEQNEKGLIAAVRNAERATVQVLRSCFLRRTEEVKHLEASWQQHKELLDLEADVGRRRAMLEMQLKELEEQRAAAEQRKAKLLSDERAREQSVQLDAEWAAAERSRMQEAASLAEELREAAAAGAASCVSRLRRRKEADDDGSDIFYSDESEVSYDTCDDLPPRETLPETLWAQEAVGLEKDCSGWSQRNIELHCVKRDLEMWLDELQHGASTAEPLPTSPGWKTTHVKRDLGEWFEDLHLAPPPPASDHGDLYRTMSEGPPPERSGENKKTAALCHLTVDEEDFLYTDIP